MLGWRGCAGWGTSGLRCPPEPYTEELWSARTGDSRHFVPLGGENTPTCNLH